MRLNAGIPSVRRIPAATVALLAASALFLGACSSNGSNNAQETSVSKEASQSISVENCGMTVTLPKPAERIVAAEQGATETLLALGAADQIVGAGHPKDLYWERNAEAAKKIPLVWPTVPKSEQIRDVDADLIVSPFVRVYSKDYMGPREDWAPLGVGAWTTNVECASPGEDAYQALERDYEQLGKLTGHEDAAATLIEEQRKAIKEATAKGNGQRIAYFYSSYEGAPYVAGGGLLTETIDQITNTTNVFKDLKEDWPSISWEAFADADPDVIYLVDLPTRGYVGDTAAEKRQMLKENPATRNMRAVLEDKFIVVPGVGLSASARAIEPLQVIGTEIAKL